MVWIPAPRVDVVHFATPPLTVVPASTLGPSLKVTVPDGAPLYDGLTVAVKVMVVPCVDWMIYMKLRLRSKELPLYVVVIECYPDVSLEVTSVNLPDP